MSNVPLGHASKIERISCKNVPHYYEPYDFDPTEEYYWAKGEKPPERPRIKPTSKRPFIIPDLVTSEGQADWFWLKRQPAMMACYHKLLGCSVFDGLCTWQDDHNEIDCRECIRATFEAYFKGCQHQEVYTDQYGTVRCAACKIELDQVEDSEPRENDDPIEEDDPVTYN